LTPEALEDLSRAELVGLVVALMADNARLAARIEQLEAETRKNSGNSSKPPSRDPAAEREAQAKSRRERRAKAAGSYNQMLWMLDPLKGATYPPS
jgi:hypothetical protein